jgi:hypothetical protein
MTVSDISADLSELSGTEIGIGGVRVAPRDWIAGDRDRDGAVVVRGERVVEVLAEAEQKVPPGTRSWTRSARACCRSTLRALRDVLIWKAPLERRVVDDPAGAPAAHAGGPGARRTGGESRFCDVEHLAAVAAGNQHRRPGRPLDELEALERVSGMDVKGWNAARAASRTEHGRP